MEKDHAIHSLRRYVNGLLDFASGMSETEVQKFMRICTTRKTKSKHVLAIHPDKRYPDLKQLGFVKLAATSGLQLRLALSDVSGVNVPSDETINEVSLHDQIFINQDSQADDRVHDNETDDETDDKRDELDQEETEVEPDENSDEDV